MIASFVNSFRGKIAGAAILITCLALLLAASVFFARQWTEERRQVIEDRTVAAEVMAANLAAPLLFKDQSAASETLAAASAIPDFQRVELFDAQGRSFAEVHGGADVPRVKPVGGAAPEAHIQYGALLVHVPVDLEGRRVGELVLVLGLNHLDAIVSDYIFFTLILMVIVAIAASLLSYWMSGRLIRPVEALSTAIRAVRASGDFSVRVETGSTDELGRLTEEFNGLLCTLDANGRELKAAMGDLVEARDAAEAASSTKSQFLSNMSHEIRTPLNGVLGMAQVMARETLSDAQRGRLDVIRSSGQGLLVLLNDLLDLAKIEAAQLDLEQTEFDLDDIVKAACDPFIGVAESKDLPLVTEIDPAASGVWLGDPTRVRQIVSNLVSNALKFTRVGGVRVEASREGDGLRIVVADTGVGIPAVKLSLLFNKFSQADASTTREYGGTGLGLSISRDLARLMGGDITVTSVEGEGARFTLALPLPRLRDADAAGEGSRDAAGESALDALAEERSVRILAAEDNLTNQLILRAMLEPTGVELTIVDNGALAVEAWSRGAFDLILMDIQMPVMDGLAATLAIRTAETAAGHARIPIIALTANAMKHQVSGYFAAGMDDYVAKPIEAEALYATLNNVLAGERRAAAA